MNYQEDFERTHEKAVADYTAEGYLLGDLPDTAAEAFEAHFFDCRVCAETVRTLQMMFAAGKGLVRPNPVPVFVPTPAPPPPPNLLTFRRRVQQSLSLAATAAIAFILGTIPHMPATVIQIPRYAGSIVGVMRGVNDDLKIHFKGNEPLAVVFGAVSRAYPRYRVELSDRSGKILYTRDLSPTEARDSNGTTVVLYPLPAGRYVLVLMGVPEVGNPEEQAKRGVVVE